MTTRERQQTFATIAIAGMFGASIGWGLLDRDAQSAPETGGPGLPGLRTAHHAPGAVGRVPATVSAAVGVPVLVNE